MNKFRTLRADEIDCRIAQIKNDGLILLLYKDARCDQNILDEAVGPMNWKREHTRDNRNCVVSIWDDDKKQWIGKEDTGTESNTEKEKGLASDSFKRSCFNWGIGRELYTAPFIWIKQGDYNLKNGKCYDHFTVQAINYQDGVIVGLQIRNEKMDKVVYTWGKLTNEKAKGKEEKRPVAPDDEPPMPFTPPAAPAPAVDVTTGSKVPAKKEEPKEASPVQAFVNNEIAYMARVMQISSKQEMTARFAAMRKSLIDMKVIKDIKSDVMTMEQAVEMIDAMHLNFIHDDYKAGKAS